jgi:hypothetical protein
MKAFCLLSTVRWHLMSIKPLKKQWCLRTTIKVLQSVLCLRTLKNISQVSFSYHLSKRQWFSRSKELWDILELCLSKRLFSRRRWSRPRLVSERVNQSRGLRLFSKDLSHALTTWARKDLCLKWRLTRILTLNFLKGLTMIMRFCLLNRICCMSSLYRSSSSR